MSLPTTQALLQTMSIYARFTTLRQQTIWEGLPQAQEIAIIHHTLAAQCPDLHSALKELLVWEQIQLSVGHHGGMEVE